MKHFSGIGILQRMTALVTEQGDNSAFALAQWIEELQEEAEETRERYLASSKDNCALRIEIEACYRQRTRLLTKIDTLEVNNKCLKDLFNED